MSGTCLVLDRSGTRCGAQSAYRYQWPGFAFEEICERHALKVRALAQAMTMTLEEIDPEAVAGAGVVLLSTPSKVVGGVVRLVKLRGDVPDEVRILAVARDVGIGKR